MMIEQLPLPAQPFHYETLCREPGIRFALPGNTPGKVFWYRTTGAHTVTCETSGKEYPFTLRPGTNDGDMNVCIHFTDVDVWMYVPNCQAVNGHSNTHDTNDDRSRTDAILQNGCLPTRAQILHALDFYTGNSDTAQHYCKDHDWFEVFNREYVRELAVHLSQRIQEHSTPEKEQVILELGAGDGRLTYFLKEELAALRVRNVQMYAVDDGDWSITAHYPIEHMKYDEALLAYSPQIVLCSWMPPQEDWTEAIRGTQSVKEYLLIGPPDSDLCGKSWHTWGKPGNGMSPHCVAPFEAAGFMRVDLSDLSRLQLCRLDLGDVRHSATISFRRMRC